jgi:NADH:ubiquinone oxidoreductase subunit K
MTEDGEQPPVWYYVVGGVLALWSAIGCYMCYMQFIHGPDAMGPADDYHRTLYAGLPVWYNYVFALAVITGLLGAIGLLTRSRAVGILFLVSLVAAVIQFGYIFVATDMIAHEGAGKVLPFPILIIAIGIFSVWFAGLAKKREYLRP